MADSPAQARSGLLHSAGVVSAAVFLSRITGVAREMVMAHFFGAGAATDAFQLAFRIPNLMRDLFAEGALSSAFVPTFSRYRAAGKTEAAELSNQVATALILVVGTLCVAGIIFSPALVRLLAPGFEEVPGKFELTVLLTRIMFPFLALIALAAQAMGVLNACDRYGVPALASMTFNVGSVLFGLAAGFTAGRHFNNGLIVSMGIGVIAGGLLQLLWQVPSLHRAGFAYRPRLHFSHPGLRQILRLMLPAILGSAAVQINVMVNTNLASGITNSAGQVIDGPVSWLGYAFRFMQLPLGLFGVAIASATLPVISRNAAAGQMQDFEATLSRSIRMVLLLTIPSAIGLAVLGESMIGAIYQSGRFQSVDTHQTAVALICYSLGLPGYAAIKLLAPAFYALDDARTPMLVSLASIGVNLAAAYSLLQWTALGHGALALSTSFVALFGAVALFLLLRHRVAYAHDRELTNLALKVALAGIVMGVVCRASSLVVHALVASGRIAHVCDAALSIPVGVAVFYGVARALKIAELEALRTACYTSKRNAPRPEVGYPSTGNR